MIIFLVSGGQSQTYSDLSISSLRSTDSLSSVVNPFQQQSSVTNLDETVKRSPIKQLHMAKEIVERYDEGVFDDGAGSQTEDDENNSVVINDSDEEDEIAHFDSNDNQNQQQQQQYLTETNNKAVNLGNEKNKN